MHKKNYIDTEWELDRWAEKIRDRLFGSIYDEEEEEGEEDEE